jgi:tetratricopeptide (TPR) repeat protein
MKKAKSTSAGTKNQKEKIPSIEISFLEGLRDQLPIDEDVLKLLGDAYTKAGRYHEGLAVDKQLATLLPDDAWVHYNLACSLSLVGDLQGAANALGQAMACGYSDWQWLLKDPDLKALRKSPAFDAIAKKVKLNKSRSR